MVTISVAAVIHQPVSNFADFDFVNFYVADVTKAVLDYRLTSLSSLEVTDASLFCLQLTRKKGDPW